MATSATTKSQIAALLALLTDPCVQTELRDAAVRMNQPNVLPLLAQGHGGHLSSGGKSTVATAISTLAADVIAN
jgi:hypothetical protein